MANISYLDMLDVVKNYYVNEPDKWASVASGMITDSESLSLLQNAGINVTLSNSGNVLGYDYTGALPALGNSVSSLDSNLQTGVYGAGSFNTNIPGYANYDSTTQLTTFTSGAHKASSGLSFASVADKVSLGVAGVALGTKLGALIDSAIYSVDPDWWDEHYPTINPQTWDDYVGADTTGGSIMRAIFGLEDNTQNTTMYLDEKMLAYTYAMMLNAGVWDSSGIVLHPEEAPTPSILKYPGNTSYYASLPISHGSEWISGLTPIESSLVVSSDAIGFLCYNVAGLVTYVAVSDRPFTISWGNSSLYVSTVTRHGITYYYSSGGVAISPSSIGTSYQLNLPVASYNSTQFDCAWDIAYLYYNGYATENSGVSGINPNNPEASYHITPTTVINPTTGQPVTPNDNIDDILNALKVAYPTLFDDAIYENVLQPDGTINQHTYIPVPVPETDENGEPITDTTEGIDPQTNPEINPQTRPEEELQNLTDQLTDETTPPDTGEGITPPITIPTGTANALYAIYNPTQGELNSFGSWLWSTNFVDQLLKLFNDPMQAIIGLHKVFAPPTISGRQNIKVGYLDSGVASNVVGEQYTTVNCGSVSLPEYFGNVFDYDPFTNVYIYLPFIGIQRLDTGDVMRSTIGVVYHVDVLTGACLAEVHVTRDGGGGVLYTYTGNCAVQYPISSGSYMGIVASLASVVGGVVGTIATGGALAPLAMGAVSGVMNAHTRVEHSGGFSGNAGAMGNKIPYLIVTRPQTHLANDFPMFDGIPSNETHVLSNCSGFVKCDSFHVENVPATDNELTEIETLLKTGIII